MYLDKYETTISNDKTGRSYCEIYLIQTTELLQILTFQKFPDVN